MLNITMINFNMLFISLKNSKSHCDYVKRRKRTCLYNLKLRNFRNIFFEIDF